MRVRHQVVFYALLVWLGGEAVGGATNRQLDGEALLSTIRTLTGPEFAGRLTGSEGGVRARAWIAARFKAIGLDPLRSEYLQPFSFTRRSVEYKNAANIVGLCKGSTAAREVVVISAHYDHLGVRGGVVHPGADDNASGVAVLLGIAEQCRRQPFTHDMLFVAFDAEELGLQGARAFVANPLVPRDRLALDINLDMVSRSDTRELFAAGPSRWPRVKPPLDEVAKRSAVHLLFGHDRPPVRAGGMEDWTDQSDHGAFHAAGIPFVYFGVEDHADYHKPTDTPEKIDISFLRQAAETILDAVVTLDAALPFGR